MESWSRDLRLYHRIDEEVTYFMSAFGAFTSGVSREVEKQEVACQHMEAVLGCARKLGGKILQDVELLERNFQAFLRSSQKGEASEKVLKEALRIKHEVSEL